MDPALFDCKVTAGVRQNAGERLVTLLEDILGDGEDESKGTSRDVGGNTITSTGQSTGHVTPNRPAAGTVLMMPYLDYFCNLA